jgi:transcription elongation GreA/GreB family factor
MNKRELVEQLKDQLRQSLRVAHTASEDAAVANRDDATPAEKRESARAAMENRGLVKAHSAREHRARAELNALDSFRPKQLPRNARIAPGALVEVEDEDTGEGRTFFLAPVGAGATLTGPGGDGLLSVVTPASPIGKAVLGCRVDDAVDVTVKGDVRAWVITYVG